MPLEQHTVRHFYALFGMQQQTWIWNEIEFGRSTFQLYSPWEGYGQLWPSGFNGSDDRRFSEVMESLEHDPMRTYEFEWWHLADEEAGEFGRVLVNESREDIADHYKPCQLCGEPTPVGNVILFSEHIVCDSCLHRPEL